MADWGRIGAGIATSGISELMRQKRTDNQWRDQDRGNYNLPGYDQRQGRLTGLAGTAAPTSSFRNDQAGLADMLRARANGAESLSAMQLRRDAGANIAQQQALAASGRPGNAALAARMASQNAGRIGTSLSGNTAMAGIAERDSAARALAGLAGQARDQDINASFGQQQINQGWSQQELDNARMQQQGGMAYENDRAQRFGVASQQPTSGEQYLGLIQGGASAAMAMSDERVKTGVKDGAASSQRFLDSLKAMDFKYKDPAMGAGPRTGLMAQDVEKTAAGKAAVVETPAGKAIDYGRLAGQFGAALAHLNQRVKKVER
jgi:hypothetical protein